MHLLPATLYTTVIIVLLAGCDGNMSSPSWSVPGVGVAQSHFIKGHFIPRWSKLANLVPAELQPIGAMRLLHQLASPAKKLKAGLYASESEGVDVYGYPANNSSNGPPSCAVPTGAVYMDDIAVDGKGNLMTPYVTSGSGTSELVVWKGPRMCGSELGSFVDPYGQPADAASADAVTGTIAISNIFDTSGDGSISVCTISGCTSNLTNSNMYEVAGVAMAKNGDCWASATDSGGAATLTYFAGCAGAGVTATGFTNTYFGGLDIDKAGNLVSIDAFTPAVRVYKGCNPACTLVGGPFSLFGDAIFGHLNKKSTAFATGDFANGEIDVYNYSPTSVTYRYSFNNGLSGQVEGAAYNPRSKE